MFIFKKGEMVHGYQIIDKFETTKSVFLVSNSSNEKFVMKALEGGMMSEEIKIGSELGSKCPFLVKVFDVFQGEDGDEHVYIIMEYCEEGDLLKRIKKKITVTDIDIYRFLYEGAEALRTLHEAGVVHRDIKSSNFFVVKNGGYKLGDYGVARVLDSVASKTLTHVGTDGYLSPEIMEGENTYTNKVDIYSFGITLLEFILGRHPYSNDSGGINMVRAVNCTPNHLALTHPHPCAKYALQMIAKDPTMRPSAADIIAAQFPLLAPMHHLAVANTFLEQTMTKQQLAQQAEQQVEHVEKQRMQAQIDTLLKETGDVTFRPNALGGYKLVRTPLGEQCLFTLEPERRSNHDRTVFLDREISEGIYSWTIRIEYAESVCDIEVGVVPATLPDADRNEFFFGSLPNTCGLTCRKETSALSMYMKYVYSSYLRGVVGEADLFSKKVLPVPHEALIVAEADMGKRTLRFFCGESSFPRAISEIPTHLHFGVKGFNRPSFTSVAFRRLSTPTAIGGEKLIFHKCRSEDDKE